jgi:hypothetical protein
MFLSYSCYNKVRQSGETFVPGHDTDRRSEMTPKVDRRSQHQHQRPEFGRVTQHDYTYTDEWTLAQWHMDYATQTFQLFINGQEIKDASFSEGATRSSLRHEQRTRCSRYLNADRTGIRSLYLSPPAATIRARTRGEDFE